MAAMPQGLYWVMQQTMRSAGNLASAIRAAARPRSDCSRARTVPSDIVPGPVDPLGRTWNVAACRGRACAQSCAADPMIQSLRLQFRLTGN